ncbi:MAG: 50S ribosomal protein L1, partial [Candidatus Aenigmarchaeota archaeon]|nr:50S ribosomal protein L1 [Candidatus Aenigmarchaeota archaeon]
MPKAIYAIKEAKEKGTGRKFTQSVDLVVSVRHLDLKKAENKFSLEVSLPSGRGKKARVGVIGSNLAIKAKGVA